jgi:DnaK suppressor protein
MKKAELERIRQALIQRESELRSIEKSSRDTTQPVELDQASVGRLSRMDAMQGQQMALETARRRQQELAAVEGALRRIELGEYGDCIVCGEEINVRRLLVAPTSTRCVACAEME